MNKYEARLPVDVLGKLVRVDAETGKLYWRQRCPVKLRSFCDPSEKRLQAWNRRFAGKEAFTTKQGMGYWHASIFGQKFLAHRVAYALHHGEWPEHEVDHINGDKRDNRPCNLRGVSHRVNMCNQRYRATNTSGFMGVSFVSGRGLYEAYIHVYGKKKALGKYKTAEEANEARQKALKEYGYHENHGEKAA